ncbi:MAG TPA: IPT/TIG domain-containing protein, partial [Candidatus Diapherotrites archaeon]|nr:IPT/TIG domain-containing protein [Candidatus Diapherotrites archaeon]
FVLPDHSVDNNDPKKKGSVVLLGGIELNAYKYNEDGVITNVDPINGNLTSDIYYEGMYDPDGPGSQPSYFLDGHMIKVQDITTIYVDLPERFYSFVGGAAPVPPYLKSEKIPVGSLKVEVLNPDGARSKEDIRFNYMDPATKPVIASVTPNSGAVAGGTVVTITGSGFKESFIEVYFGSEKSESVEYINGTLIRATVPDYPYALPAGQDFLDVPVMVLNYDGGAAVLENGFRYRIPGSNPVIVSITPNNGSSAGNDRVLIEGLDFRRTADFSDDGLPKVYFNGREAEVIWPALNTTTIAESLTVITPPSLTSGAAEVILVNHDSGTCIYRGFTYVMSRPSITSVMPERINRRGNVNVQINGSGFRAGSLENLFASAVEKADRHVSSTVYETVYAKDVIETLAAFGDFETGDKRIIDTVVGPTYAEIGDLRFDCEVMGGATERVNVRISLASDSTHSTIRRYRMDGDVKTFDSMAEADITIGSSHLFIINHEMDLNKPGIYDEGILVETSPSSVTITRRIAPYADVQYDGTQLTVKAPPTERLGTRKLYVINDDGGKASKGITIMSPDSSPWIFAITPVNKARDMITNQIVDFVPENIDDYSEIFTFVPLDGGAFMTISGSDFRRNVKVYLDDRPVEILSKSINDDQLVIKVPPGAETDLGKDLRIVVVNEDGGTYDSSMLPKPHYIRYQTQDSNPVIERIVPNKSSSRGSNYIAIHGNNFRAGVKVFIEGVEGTAERGYLNAQGQRVKESEYLSVLVPTGLTPGSKTVQVLNTDFGFTELRNGLTIISTPEITAVYDDRNEEIRPLVLSVEGGEKIRLEGIQFMAGIKVIFGGTLKAKSELAEGESGLEGFNINNAEMVVIGGTTAADVTLNSSGDIL